MATVHHGAGMTSIFFFKAKLGSARAALGAAWMHKDGKGL
jgi:hypothetical protein